MKRVAIIPARAGSKRLPNKNIRTFHGKPLISYTIEHAIDSKQFDEIIVSTDSKVAQEIASDLGVRCYWRSADLANDSSTITDVCMDLLLNSNQAWDQLVVLYATSPLRKAQDIYEVISLLDAGHGVYSSVSVCQYSHPIHQALEVDEHGFVAPKFPNQVEMKSNEVAPCYIDNGSIYAVSVNAFLDEKTFYCGKTAFYEMPLYRSIDIDTLEDFILAEKLYGRSSYEVSI